MLSGRFYSYGSFGSIDEWGLGASKRLPTKRLIFFTRSQTTEAIYDDEGRSMNRYGKCIEFWDGIFSKETSALPKKKETGNAEFDKGLEWLTEGASSVLDFGCGNGTVLFLCNKYGTTVHIGIDLSPQAIKSAVEKSRTVEKGNFRFICGGAEALKEICDGSVDCAVLSNIIDNLYPDDAVRVLDEIGRILKKNGKLLVKLNPYITDRQKEEYGIKTVSGNLLDDGLLLWNNTNDEWENIFASRFSMIRYTEIYYEEYEQSNRMYLLTKQ